MKQKRLGPINQQKSQGPTSDPKTANRQAITKAPFYKGACAPVACPANSAGNAPWFGENHPKKNGTVRGEARLEPFKELMGFFWRFGHFRRKNQWGVSLWGLAFRRCIHIDIGYIVGRDMVMYRESGTSLRLFKKACFALVNVCFIPRAES